MSSEKFLRNIFLKIIRLSILPQSFTADQFREAEIKKILVIKRHQMGDMLCCLPMMKVLRTAYPDAHITLVTKASTNYKRIFDTYDTYCNEVLEYEFGFENIINLVKHLRDTGYELAVIPSTVVFSATNHLIAFYAHAKFRVGASCINALDNNSEFLLNIKKDFLWDSQKVHQIERNLDIIRLLNLNTEDKNIDIPLSEERINFANEFINKNYPDRPLKLIGRSEERR